MRSIKTYTNGCDKVIAVTEFKGLNIPNQTVRGVAKCDSSDTFVEAYGQELATARVNMKLADLILDDALVGFDNATQLLEFAKAEFDKASHRLTSARKHHVKTAAELSNVEDKYS